MIIISSLKTNFGALRKYFEVLLALHVIFGEKVGEEWERVKNDNGEGGRVFASCFFKEACVE